jgi:glycosyltransferase involved in cell wall biosynthesis
MIVKNEAHVIRRCLDAVRPFIDNWIIVDTGSTDGTQAIIREHLEDIPGELFERPWQNFGHNRSEALALARAKADYIFVIDADNQLIVSPDFKRSPAHSGLIFDAGRGRRHALPAQVPVLDEVGMEVCRRPARVSGG